MSKCCVRGNSLLLNRGALLSDRPQAIHSEHISSYLRLPPPTSSDLLLPPQRGPFLLLFLRQTLPATSEAEQHRFQPYATLRLQPATHASARDIAKKEEEEEEEEEEREKILRGKGEGMPGCLPAPSAPILFPRKSSVA
eukprot:2037557-Rhodomonas_salina.1